MKGGRDGKGPPSTDLLICFPSRAHLTLMPKPICSPARPSEPKNFHNHRPNRSRHMRRPSGGGRGHASPLFWAKTKPTNSDISEPTSPKVTCAGQVKVRPKPSSCKNWHSVMEEIERLHVKKKKKRAAWMGAMGFKKDVMQFLTCLRSLRFDFRCFGSFPSAEITSDDDDEDDDDGENEDQFEDAEDTNGEKNIQSTGKMNDQCDENDESRTIFSKWFMILQQNTDRSKELITEIKERKRKTIKSLFDEELMEEDDDDEAPPCAPPSNALLLMRCRSAPAKSWQEEKEEEKEEESEDKCEETGNEESKESLVVMAYGADFSKFSSDIVKETWVVGGITDLLSRSRSWKR